MPQAIFAYHLGMDAEQYAFFRIPKLLITEPYFRRLSTDAKLLYGLMLDRMSLSMRNGWMDDDGHVYNPPFCERHRRGYETCGLSHIFKICYNIHGEFGTLQNPWR